MPKRRMLNVPFRLSHVRKGHGYAWAIAEGTDAWRFCNWVAPTKDGLLQAEKPSPEARLCKVAIVPIRPAYLLSDDDASGIDLRKWKAEAIDRLGLDQDQVAEIDYASRVAQSETEQ